MPISFFIGNVSECPLIWESRRDSLKEVYSDIPSLFLEFASKGASHVKELEQVEVVDLHKVM